MAIEYEALPGFGNEEADGWRLGLGERDGLGVETGLGGGNSMFDDNTFGFWL